MNKGQNKNINNENKLPKQIKNNMNTFSEKEQNEI